MLSKNNSKKIKCSLSVKYRFIVIQRSKVKFWISGVNGRKSALSPIMLALNSKCKNVWHVDTIEFEIICHKACFIVMVTQKKKNQSPYSLCCLTVVTKHLTYGKLFCSFICISYKINIWGLYTVRFKFKYADIICVR